MEIIQFTNKSDITKRPEREVVGNKIEYQKKTLFKGTILIDFSLSLILSNYPFLYKKIYFCFYKNVLNRLFLKFFSAFRLGLPTIEMESENCVNEQLVIIDPISIWSLVIAVFACFPHVSAFTICFQQLPHFTSSYRTMPIMLPSVSI